MADEPFDIVDLDAALDQFASQKLLEASARQGTREEASALESEKLAEFGYQPPQPEGVGSYWGGLGTGGQDRAQRQKAIERGFLADDPYFLQHHLDDIDPIVKAQYTGVDVTGGAEPEAKRLIKLLPSDLSSDFNTITKILQKVYTKAHGVPLNYDYNVRVEPSTERLIFNNPENNNQPTFIHKPGIQKEDWRPFIAPIAAEIAGGLTVGGLGALTGSPGVALSGAVVGEALGTFAYRMHSLLSLREEGLLPPDYSDQDIWMNAIKESGMTALFSAGGVGVFKLAKIALGLGGVTKKFGLDTDEFVQAYEAVVKANTREADELLKQADLLADAGDDAGAAALRDRAANIVKEPSTLTAPQLMIRGADEGVEISSPGWVAATEAELRDLPEQGGTYAKPLTDLYAAQEQALRDYGVGAFEGAGVAVAPAVKEATEQARLAAGRRFRAAAREGLEANPQIAQSRANIKALGQQADDIFAGLTDKTADPVRAGRRLQETFQGAKNEASTIVNTKYNEAAGLAGFLDGRVRPYDYTSLTAKAQDILRSSRQRGFPDLKTEGVLQTLIKRFGDESPKRTHKIFTEDLHALRGLITDRINNGQHVGDLQDLEKTFAAVRTRALAASKNPDAVRMTTDADAMYTQFKEEFSNDLIRGMLATQSASSNLYRQGNREAYEGFVRFLRNNVEVLDDGTLRSPEYINKVILDPQHTDALLSVKNTLRGEFRDKIFQQTDQGLQPNPQAYAAFMEENGPLLRKFFDEDELAQFADADTFLQRYTGDLEAAKATIAGIERNSYLKGFAETLEPSSIFRKTWRKGEIKASQELHQVLTDAGNDQLIKSYKAHILNDFLDSTQVKNDIGEAIFNPNRVDDYISNHGDSLNLWLGDGFTQNLDKINKKMRALQDPTKGPITIGSSEIVKATNSLARAYVGIFTTPGRVLTAMKNLYGGAAANRATRLLVDPDRLYQIIMRDQWLRNPVLKGTVRELGRIFYREGVYPPDFTADSEAELESLIGGPGFQETQFQETPERREFNLGGHVVRDLGTLPLRYGFK